MLNYEEFKKVLEEQLSYYLPESLAGSKVEMHSVEKVNGPIDEIAIIPQKESGQAVHSMLNVGALYDEYQRIGDVGAIMEQTVERLLENDANIPANVMEVIDGGRDKIIMMLINTEQNKQLLEKLPHRDIFDLSIVYRLAVDVNQNGMQSCLVDYKLAEKYGMDEQALYQAAKAYTKEVLPPVVKDMNEVMRDMLKKDGMPDEIIEECIPNAPSGLMYVISNSIGVNGAVSMLYEDELQKLAEKLGSDLYILPSSLHEVIAVPSHLGELEQLAEMVHQVNMTTVDLKDRLSNQVYHYDKELRTLTLATNTPNKLLENQVAEPQMIYETGQSR